MPDFCLEVKCGCLEGIIGGEDEKKLELSILNPMVSFGSAVA